MYILWNASNFCSNFQYNFQLNMMKNKRIASLKIFQQYVMCFILENNNIYNNYFKLNERVLNYYIENSIYAIHWNSINLK